MISHTVKNGKKTATLKEKYLTGATDACGYKHLRLVTDDGKTVLYKIHTLIYLAFNPDYKHVKEKYGRKIIIHHKDHDKTNNKLDNLELISALEHRQEHTKDYWKNNPNGTKRLVYKNKPTKYQLSLLEKDNK